MQKAKRWPKRDRIAWVGQRLLERLAAREGRINDLELDAKGVPDQTSLEVWLAKERDGLSWQQIVIKYFPNYPKSKRKSAGISKARRVYDLVERALEPTPQRKLQLWLDQRIRNVFNCTPEQFKRYLKSI